jgi:hypothetical protein
MRINECLPDDPYNINNRSDVDICDKTSSQIWTNAFYDAYYGTRFRLAGKSQVQYYFDTVP